MRGVLAPQPAEVEGQGLTPLTLDELQGVRASGGYEQASGVLTSFRVFNELQDFAPNELQGFTPNGREGFNPSTFVDRGVNP